MTNYSRSVLKSNGLRHSKNPPVRFSFSLKIVPANIAQKLPAQRCSKPLFIAFFNFSHKRPTFAFTGKVGTHSPFGKRSHTRAHTAKQGHSLPRPQYGFALPVNSFLFRHAFIYIHFPVLCEPSTSAEGENPAKLPSQTLSQTVSHPNFQLLAQTAYVCFHGRKRVHTRLRQ